MDPDIRKPTALSLRKQHLRSIQTDYLREKGYHVEREKELIVRISKIFTSHAHLKDCLSNVLHELASFVGRSVSEVWLTSIDGRVLRLTAQLTSKKTTQLTPEKLEYNMARGLIGKAWKTKAEFYLENLEASKEFTRPEFVLPNSLISGTAIPIMSKDDVIAVLGFYGTPDAENQFPVNLSPNVIAQLASDIKRKKVEEELHHFFSLSPDLLGMAGVDGYFKKINPSFNRVLGFSEHELLTQPFTEFIHPDDQHTVVEAMTHIVEGNSENSFEARCVTSNQEVRWITWSGSFLADDELLFLVGKDITEKKKLEISITESEERFRVIFEQAAVGVAMLNSMTGQLLRLNKKYCEIFGYSHEELNQMTFMEITHPDDLEADLENMRRLLKGEIREFSMEKRHFRKDKSIIWVNLSVSPMWKEGETPTTHIAIVQDITARKIAEEKIMSRELN